MNIIFSVKKFVDENYSDIDLTLKSVSAHFSYNAKYISDKFLKTVGTGFNAYLTQLRLEHAILLMENGFKNIQEIAGFSGFRDPLYFSRVFKKFYHVSPREYISKIQN